MSIAKTIKKNSIGPYVLEEVNILMNLTIRFLTIRGM